MVLPFYFLSMVAAQLSNSEHLPPTLEKKNNGNQDHINNGSYVVALMKNSSAALHEPNDILYSI